MHGQISDRAGIFTPQGAPFESKSDWPTPSMTDSIQSSQRFVFNALNEKSNDPLEEPSREFQMNQLN